MIAYNCKQILKYSSRRDRLLAKLKLHPNDDILKLIYPRYRNNDFTMDL